MSKGVAMKILIAIMVTLPVLVVGSAANATSGPTAGRWGPVKPTPRGWKVDRNPRGYGLRPAPKGYAKPAIVRPTPRGFGKPVGF
jgi:hypothetical protein